MLCKTLFPKNVYYRLKYELKGTFKAVHEICSGYVVTFILGLKSLIL